MLGTVTVTATTSRLLFVFGSLTTLKCSSHCSHYVDERMLSPNKRVTLFFQGLKLALSKETLDLILCDVGRCLCVSRHAGMYVCECLYGSVCNLLSDKYIATSFGYIS